MRKGILACGVLLVFSACGSAGADVAKHARLDGGIEGGGGKGVLCGTVLRTLDIYEAEEIYHLPPVQKFATVDENTLKYGTQLAVYWSTFETTPDDPNMQQETMEGSHKLIGLFRDISPGSTLSLTQDATLPPIPSTCAFVQIAIYDDANNIINRDPMLWNMLDAYDQSALISHEIYYQKARSRNATTSDETRRMIGLGMFNQLPEPRMKPMWGLTDWLECSDENYQFALRGREGVIKGVSGIVLYAEVFEGQLADFRTTAFLPGVSLADFGSSLRKNWQTQVQNEFTGEKWIFELDVDNSFGSVAKMRAWKDGQPAPAFSIGSCVPWHVGGAQ